MTLDVAIITRDRRAALIRNLTAVSGQLTTDDRCDVLENGCPVHSTDGLSQRFPDVIFHRSDANLGVSGGRNAVASYGSGEVLVFIDDDAVPCAGLLDGLRTRFARRPALGVLAFRIDDPRTGRPRTHEFPHRRNTLYNEQFHPTYFVGAGFAVRRQLFAAAGGFDSTLFYSLEELDLSFRLLDLQAEFLYDPTLRVTHHAANTDGQLTNLTHIVRNRWIVPPRYLPWPMAVSHIALWSLYHLVRAVRHRAFVSWWNGVVAGALRLPTTIRERRPVSAATVQRLRTDQGRLWW